jgi:hypothetical protein|tara:strand:+ start:3457 stop:3630 length:174 start_codon:yes stop_codon:yes gene_type:complete
MKLIFSSKLTSNDVILNNNDEKTNNTPISFNSKNKISYNMFKPLMDGKKGCSSCGKK